MAANRTACSGANTMRALFLIVSAAQISISSGFLSTNVDRPRVLDANRHRDVSTTTSTRYAASNDNDASDDATDEGLGFSALPPIGGSSFWDSYAQDDNAYANAYDSSDLARPNNGQGTSKNGIIVSEHTNLVSNKFKIQYTCKVCDTRNSHSVTRMAYRKGVVIAMCKGCHSKHLLADNLGWSNYIGGFDFDNGETNIEMYMANRDQEVKESGTMGEKENDLVMRVSQDVFDLENVLYKGGQEGKLSVEGTGEGDGVEDGTSWS